MPNAFAQQRQAALLAGPLNKDYWAEDVQMQVEGAWQTVTVKISLGSVNDAQGRLVGATGIFSQGGTTDQSERIDVCLSRDPTNATAVPNTPMIGSQLIRSETRDADRRPYSYKGECKQQEEFHAVYVFERPRRAAQGKRA